MAYITNYAYNHLIKHIKIKDTPSFIDKAFFRKNIYDNDYLYQVFNQLDLKKLLKEKVLCSNNEDNYKLAYKKVPDNVDRKRYIYEKKGSVKYHKTASCKSLNSGFKDFLIPKPIYNVPDDIPHSHNDLVDAIREWFLKNNYTVDRYLNGNIDDNYLTRQFNKNFAPRFGVDKIVISQSDKNQFKWYEEKKTSGSQYLSNNFFDYDKFIIDISDLLRKRDNLCTGRVWYSISKYDYLYDKSDKEIEKSFYELKEKGRLKNVSENFLKNFGMERFKNFLIEHRELKEQAMQGLSDYFKWTYNFKQDNFNKVFLENFNLKPCMMCYNVEGKLQ